MITATSSIYYTLAQEQALALAFEHLAIPVAIAAGVGCAISVVVYLFTERTFFERMISVMMFFISGVCLLSLGILSVFVFRQPLIFSPSQMLEPLWSSYKAAYIDPGTGRTVDPDRGNISTSEGESYTMLRAVWRGDKETFDTSWEWTQKNLERTDHLYAWLYVDPSISLASTTLTANDIKGKSNSASDADTNIALALLFAYTRWQDPAYLNAAKLTIQNIWEEETIVIGNRAYVLANNVEKSSESRTVLINPSYLNPAAYRLFALIDTEHPWSRAVDGTYSLLTRATEMPLDATTTGALPPDWIRIDRRDGSLSTATATTTSYSSQFGYDAMRVIWNVSLDYEWNGEERARDYLDSLTFFETEWNKKNTLMAIYTHAGSSTPNGSYETPAMYGATIGYYKIIQPSLGEHIYRTKLEPLYDSDTNTWREQLSYYDDNITWFGIALFHHLLPNLAVYYPLANLSGS